MNHAMDFSGQSAIVTGAATGIGEATTKLLAERGATVTLMDIDRAGAERVAGEVKAAGGKAHVKIVDLTKWDDTRAAIEEAHKRDGKIDVLVHSAGGFDASSCLTQSSGSVAKPPSATNAAMRRGAHACADTMWP